MRERFQNLQVLRGAACLAVVIFHAATEEARFGLHFSPLWPAMWCGYAGVDLFFVLSGFIIAATCRADLGRPARLPRYLFRRAWRVYPTFWAVFALSVPMMSAVAGGALFDSPWSVEVLDAVLLLPGDGVAKAVGVAWTLWFEVMFYAAFAVLFLLPRRAAVPALVGWGVVVVAAYTPGTRPENRFVWLATSPFVLEFLAGALIAWYPVRLSGRQAAALVACAAWWCAGLSAAFYNPDPAWLPASVGRRVVVFGVTAAVVVLALSGWERAGGRLKWQRLETIGDASYSVYLLHAQMLFLVSYLSIRYGWNHSRVSHAVWLAAMLAAGVLPPMLFHRFVEKPLLNLAKTRREPALAAAPAPHVPTRRAA